MNAYPLKKHTLRCYMWLINRSFIPK
jgi:hypothetical protein